jgi:hypothetical protein
MSGAVRGDPASCSQVGGALRQLSSRLRVTGRQAHNSFDLPDGPRPSPAVLSARRRFDLVDAAVATSATELDRIGAALQRHASDLAEAVAAVRELAERAEAAGLRLDQATLTPAWGVTGLADAPTSATQERRQAELQAELDSIARLLAQRRHRLDDALLDSGVALSTHAAALRR